MPGATPRGRSAAALLGTPHMSSHPVSVYLGILNIYSLMILRTAYLAGWTGFTKKFSFKRKNNGFMFFFISFICSLSKQTSSADLSTTSTPIIYFTVFKNITKPIVKNTLFPSFHGFPANFRILDRVFVSVLCRDQKYTNVKLSNNFLTKVVIQMY